MCNVSIKCLLLIFSSLLLTSSFNLLADSSTSLEVTKSAMKKIKPQKIVSKATLADLLRKHHTNRYNYNRYYTMLDTLSPGGTVATSKVSHSDTNVQVQGVDEADTVKVGDDGYIYQINNNQVRIVKGIPVEELAQSATISFPDNNFYPSGIYVQDGKLAILGTSWQTIAQPDSISKTIYPWWGGWSNYAQTRVLIYDVTDHEKPLQIRDVAIDGDYISSRKIDSDLYFVARTYPRYYLYGGVDSVPVIKAADMLPSISDTSSVRMSKRLLPLKDLSFFPDFVEPDYVVVASINLDRPEQTVETKAYLGAGEMVYASTKNLYLSASKYNFNYAAGKMMPLDDGAVGMGITVPNTTNTDTISTQIFKFKISNGQINFSAAGEVPGTVLNQFSMDENGDYFRIATTTPNWYSSSNQSTNSLFVLNKSLKTVGKLENLAEGEQIYSARFIGDRCYLVTFRLVDPLFAIDLSQPDQPSVIGELKIPGYSNYLHPYDETHLIGFGKNAAVYQSEQANPDQFWAGGSAFYQGLKVALFDVADMANPKELYSITIGDRGTNSPLLWDHKALYWDQERHLFGFPVELYQLSQTFDETQPWKYGLPIYQGAYIYEITPETGFALKATLSQIPDGIGPHKDSYNGYDYAWWDWDATNLFVNRLLRIDTNLYTLSNNQINVYSLNDYQALGKLGFSQSIE